MAKVADLHIHTNYSDSTSSPEEVLSQAHKYGIDCIAITDHDIIDGVQPAMDAAKQYDIEVLAGVELSTQINNKDVHMLGYMFDHHDESLKEYLKKIQSSRIGRMRQMINKLSEMGVGPIDFDEVCALTESDAVGRPHLATIMVKNGIVPNIKAAFDRYIADDKPAFVPKIKISPFEGIELIIKYGGVPVLAHPMFTQVDELIPQFVEAGLKGIEAHYPNCSPKTIEYYVKLADKHNIVATGGSDAHGDAKKNTYLGKMTVPYDKVELLKGKVYGQK